MIYPLTVVHWHIPGRNGGSGLRDGSVIMFNEDKTFTASQRHRAAVTSIACVPSQHIYVVGGGNTMRIIKLDTAQTIKDGDVVKMDSKRHSFDNDADIVAIAGPFIVMQPKEGDPFIQSFYSFSAYKAITDGTFQERQKTFFSRIGLMLKTMDGPWGFPTRTTKFLALYAQQYEAYYKAIFIPRAEQ